MLKDAQVRLVVIPEEAVDTVQERRQQAAIDERGTATVTQPGAQVVISQPFWRAVSSPTSAKHADVTAEHQRQHTATGQEKRPDQRRPGRPQMRRQELIPALGSVLVGLVWVVFALVAFVLGGGSVRPAGAAFAPRTSTW